MKALAGLRHSEAAGLRWRQYDHSSEPLGALNLERTKTQVPRPGAGASDARAHPRGVEQGGWERTYGRAPDGRRPHRPDAEHDRALSPGSAERTSRLDLAILGLRHRRGPRSPAHVHHAGPGRRRPPGPPGDHHPRAPREHHQRLHDVPVAGALRGGRQAPHQKSKNWGRENGSKSASAGRVLDGEPRSLATGLATAQRNWRNRWRKSATPAGFEPAFMP